MSRRKPNIRAPRTRSAASGQREGIEIFGIHAVAAALANPSRRIRAIYVSGNAERRLGSVLTAREIPVTRVSPKDLDRRLGADTVHQGALVETDALAEPELDDLLAPGDADGLPARIIVLDQVSDPQNVGAILRSASVFGARGLVMTRRASPPLAGVLAKAASGGLEHVPVALVSNLARALETLGRLGVQRLGLDGEAACRLEDQALDGPLAIVLGAEGRGLRRLTREHCDVLCRIATTGPLASLNVSNAAAIALHWARVRSARIRAE